MEKEIVKEEAGRTLYLYLHDEVSDISCTELIEAIKLANDESYMSFDELINDGSKRSEAKIEKIVLSILSGGGYVSAGMALINVIEQSKIPVECEVHFGASMACVIAVACHKRRIHKRGSLLWHNISAGVQGDHETLKETMKHLEIDKQQADSIIKERTKLTDKDLKAIYRAKKDKVYYAEDCLSLGLVDEII